MIVAYLNISTTTAIFQFLGRMPSSTSSYFLLIFVNRGAAAWARFLETVCCRHRFQIYRHANQTSVNQNFFTHLSFSENISPTAENGQFFVNLSAF